MKKRGRPTSFDHDKALHDFAEGVGLHEIAEAAGVTYAAVRYVVCTKGRRMGWEDNLKLQERLDRIDQHARLYPRGGKPPKAIVTKPWLYPARDQFTPDLVMRITGVSPDVLADWTTAGQLPESGPDGWSREEVAQIMLLKRLHADGVEISRAAEVARRLSRDVVSGGQRGKVTVLGYGRPIDLSWVAQAVGCPA